MNSGIERHSIKSLTRADRLANGGDRKALFIVLMFRLTAATSRIRNPFFRVFAQFVRAIYRFLVDWVLGVEIPWFTQIGPGLRLQHAHGITINGLAVIGANVSVHQNVTIGAQRTGTDCPDIGDGVKIGAGAIILGDISIGTNAVVGAGAVVTKSVPANGVVAGNPAVLIRIISDSARL